MWEKCFIQWRATELLLQMLSPGNSTWALHSQLEGKIPPPFSAWPTELCQDRARTCQGGLSSAGPGSCPASPSWRKRLQEESWDLPQGCSFSLGMALSCSPWSWAGICQGLGTPDPCPLFCTSPTARAQGQGPGRCLWDSMPKCLPALRPGGYQLLGCWVLLKTQPSVPLGTTVAAL